ncbi:MAG: hypothetical protein RMK19_05180 [Bacteroidia bacterium]|nr:hypothetical protein [Bacteroidia bacterium]MDW8015385.1 hypothetical protein [Bacteroidia bacterium]
MIIYVALLLRPDGEEAAAKWRAQVEKWRAKENIQEYPLFLWWYFLHWYEAYRIKSKRWMRHWLRKVRLLWEQRFSFADHWIPILRVMRSATTGLASTVRRRAQYLLSLWTQSPALKRVWEREESIFPMILFIKSLVHQHPLENYPPVPLSPRTASPEMEEKVRSILDQFSSLK